MHLLCRADAGQTIGAGHAVRAWALAEAAIARGWRVTVAGDISVPWLRRELALRGLAPVPGFVDEETMTATIAALHVDAVAVDHYGLPTTLHAAATAVGVPLLSVEDFAFGRRPADVVVNYHVGAGASSRPEDGSVVVLLGPDYAPMRSAVLAARRERGDRSRPAGPLRVMVAMGGTDATDATGAVLDALAGTGLPLDVTVVGAAATAASRGHMDITTLSAGQPLPSLLVDADVAVCAAGVSTYESLCIGVPTALLAVVENQLQGYRRLVEGSRLRDDAGTATSELRSWLADVDGRAAMAERSRSAVDGLGCDRVLDVLADMAR
jgi:spore coat polysaccharide biosynthesis predicted glycosyltransferase SpsG